MDDDLAALRHQYYEGRTHEEPEERIHPDFAALDSKQWHRMVIERARYERGELTDWPNAVPLTEEEKRVLGEMGDIISRFRRVK